MIARNRTPWVISLAISGLVHLGLLAWVVIDVPELTDVAGMVDRSGAPAADEAPEERVVQVIRIQPPGLLQSGGSAGTQGEGGGGQSASRAVPALAELQFPLGSISISPAHSTELALEAPREPSPGALLALLPATQNSGNRSARPNRGLTLRSGSAENRPTGGRSGSGETGRRGVGLGGSGATSIGAGPDCITVGATIPENRLPGVGASPRRGIQGRGPSRGRSGRP